MNITFENDVLYYEGIPLNLYGVIGIFKMFNYSFNPSVWSSGLTEMKVDYTTHYSVTLDSGVGKYLFETKDLFIIKNWLRDNHREWYDLLPSIDSQIKE